VLCLLSDVLPQNVCINSFAGNFHSFFALRHSLLIASLKQVDQLLSKTGLLGAKRLLADIHQRVWTNVGCYLLLLGLIKNAI